MEDMEAVPNFTSITYPLPSYPFLLLLLSHFSRVRLCDPIDGSPPGSLVPKILQARTLEWVSISFSSAWEWSESEVAQSCPTLSDPMDCSLPGSSFHGIFQARVLKWVRPGFICVVIWHSICFRIGLGWT